MLETAAPLQIKRTILDEIQDEALLRSPALEKALSPAGEQLRQELVNTNPADVEQAGKTHTAAPERADLIAFAVESELTTFTGREREVLFLIERGLPVKHIARALTISPDTAKFHVKNIYQKLGVHDRVAACDAIRKMQLFDKDGR